MTIYQLVKVGRYERSLSGVISLISDTAVGFFDYRMAT